MRKNKFAALLILIAGILWGCIGIFVRILNSLGISSMKIVVLRSGITAFCMFIILLIFDRPGLKIRLKDLWCFLGTGIASIVFFNFCYFRAIELASMAAAAILLYTAPSIVMVLSFVLFRERFSRKKVISLVLTFVGCCLVTGIGAGAKLSVGGVLAGLGAGFGYALYSIFGRFALDRGYSTFTITFYTFLIAFVASFFMTDSRQVFTDIAANPKHIMTALLFGILCTVLPYLCYTLGLRKVETGTAAIIASIEPVTAAVIGSAVFGERITIQGGVGIVLVLSALVLCNTSAEKRRV